jgi:hypothetical protein
VLFVVVACLYKNNVELFTCKQQSNDEESAPIQSAIIQLKPGLEAMT